MTIYIISDTHFGHDKMVEYCGRPSNHESIILINTEKALAFGDTLIHLGDFCIGKDEEWHKKFLFYTHLCRTILVRGNHDGKSNSWYLDHGWTWVCRTFTDKYFGKKIKFSHKPNNAGDHDINLHGHWHNSNHHPEDLTSVDERSVLYAPELNDYMPVKLQSIVEGKACAKSLERLVP